MRSGRVAVGNDVTIEIRGDNKGLNNALKQSQSMFGSWTKTIIAGAAAIATALSFRSLFNFTQDILDAINSQEAALTKLESVLRATGHAAGYSSQQLQAIASDLQTLTGIGDDEILNLQAIIASFREIKGDNFREATKAALDMSAVLGGDLKSSAIQLGKALNDPIRGMSALSRSGVTFSDEQRELITTMQEMGDIAGAQRVILDELAHEFGGAAADQATTFAGTIRVLSNRIGELYETLGSLLIPVLNVMAPVLDVIVTAFENLAGKLEDSSEGAKVWSETWGTYLADTFKWVAMGAAEMFSLFEFLWTNFSNIAERTALSWILSLVKVVEQMKYLFTEVAPAYTRWFYDNWWNLIKDFANMYATVLTNMFKNLNNFIIAVWEMMSGGDANFEFTALTDGFEATTKKLPEIAERMTSETERTLEQGIAAIDEAMGKSWNDIYDKNTDFVDGLFKDVEKPEVDLTPKIVKSDADADSMKKNAEETAKSFKKAEDSKKSMAGTSTGLEQLAKDIQLSIAGGPTKAEDKFNTEQFEKAQKIREAQAKSLKQIADKQNELIKAAQLAGGLA